MCVSSLPSKTQGTHSIDTPVSVCAQDAVLLGTHSTHTPASVCVQDAVLLGTHSIDTPASVCAQDALLVAMYWTDPLVPVDVHLSTVAAIVHLLISSHVQCVRDSLNPTAADQMTVTSASGGAPLVAPITIATQGML